MNKEQLLKELFEPTRKKDPKVELAMKHRHLDAQELGRICPDETPDYIGNFYGLDIDLGRNSAKGIFEMTINEEDDFGNFKGIAKDCFGDALVEGKISDDEIIFTKKYIPEKSSIEASTKTIIYESTRSSSNFKADYVGGWRHEDYQRNSHDFWMLGFKRHV